MDDSPEYNVARDRFLGTTTTSATNLSPTLRRDDEMLGAVKKPFGFVQYYGGDKEMVFTPNSPNKSRLSSTTTKKSFTSSSLSVEVFGRERDFDGLAFVE